MNSRRSHDLLVHRDVWAGDVNLGMIKAVGLAEITSGLGVGGREGRLETENQRPLCSEVTKLRRVQQRRLMKSSQGGHSNARRGPVLETQ